MSRLSAVLSALLVALAAPTAQAQILTTPFYSPGYVQVINEDPSLLRAEHQFFSPTYRGLTELCTNLPHLCAEPGAQAALGTLRAQRRRSLGLQIGGGALSVVGLGTTVVALVNGSAAPGGSGRIVGYVGLGALTAGLVVGVVGAAIAPGREEVRGVVNRINQAHPNDPVQWSWSLDAGAAGPGVSLAARF